MNEHNIAVVYPLTMSYILNDQEWREVYRDINVWFIKYAFAYASFGDFDQMVNDMFRCWTAGAGGKRHEFRLACLDLISKLRPDHEAEIMNEIIDAMDLIINGGG